MFIRCRSCRKDIEVPDLTIQQDWLLSTRSMSIQQILPDWDPALRELLISGICPECWKKMFDFDEEGGEDDDIISSTNND